MQQQICKGAGRVNAVTRAGDAVCNLRKSFLSPTTHTYTFRTGRTRLGIGSIFNYVTQICGLKNTFGWCDNALLSQVLMHEHEQLIA